MTILGVDIAILGVGIANLRRQEKGERLQGGGGGVDIAFLGIDVAVLSVDITILGVDITILGVDKANLRRREKKGRDYRGREKGVVSRVRRLEAGWIAREFGGTKSHEGHGAPYYKWILGV